MPVPVNTFPYLTPAMLESEEVVLLNKFAIAYPAYSWVAAILEVVAESAVDTALLQWICNYVNGVTGATPPA